MMLRIAGAILAVGLCVAGCTTAAMDDATVRRLTREGVNPDLIHLAKVPGFTAVEQSMGPAGDGGFRMMYVSDSDPANRAEFRVQSTEFTHELCASTPIPNADPAASIECVDDGKGWYRSSNGFHEYVLLSKHGHMRLSAPIDALSDGNLRDTLNNSVSRWDDGPGVVDVVP